MDVLLKRYGNIEYINTLKPVKLSNLLKKAYDKELERTAWEYWLTLDNQAKKNNPFNKFMESLRKEEPSNNDKRTEEEIVNDAQNILKLMKRSN